MSFRRVRVSCVYSRVGVREIDDVDLNECRGNLN